MRPRDHALRALVGGGLLALSVGVVVPMGLGLWDPSWLRLAGDVRVDTTHPSLEPGEVRHPFVVEQCDPQGRLRWRLSGGGLRGPSDAADLLKDQFVVEPRLELFSYPPQGTEITRLTAAGARVQVQEGSEGQRSVRLDLGPRLVLSRGDVELRGDSLVVRFDPQHPTELSLRAKDPLQVSFRAAGASWTLEARGLEAAGRRLDLVGPLQLSGGPLVGGGLASYRVEGSALGARLEPAPLKPAAPGAGESSAPAGAPAGAPGGFEGPWRLSARGLDLRGVAGPGEEFELQAARGVLDLERTSSSVDAGPVTSASEGRPTPKKLLLDGQVVGRFRRVAPASDLQLRGDRLSVYVGQKRLSLVGSPARLAEEIAGFRAAGQRFEIRGRPQGGLGISADSLESLEIQEGLPGGEASLGSRARWVGRAGAFALELDPSPSELSAGKAAEARAAERLGTPAGAAGVSATAAEVASASRALGFAERIRSLNVQGGLNLSRVPGPDRFEVESIQVRRRSDAAAGHDLSLRRLRALLAPSPSAPSSRRAAAGGASTAPLDSRVPWRLEAGALKLRSRGSLASLAALASASVAPLDSGTGLNSGTGLDSSGPGRDKPGPPWAEPLAALESLEASAGVVIQRRGEEQDARRRLRKGRGLAAERLSFSRQGGVLVAKGGALVDLGSMKLRAPALRLTPATGVVLGQELELVLTRLVAAPRGERQSSPAGSGDSELVREVYRARAGRGKATLSLDPADWAEERVRRRGRRRSGAALTLPEPLHALELQGGVSGRGPRGAVAEASRVVLEGRRARLSGSPARLGEERGLVSAREVSLSWEEADLAPLSSASPGGARDATEVFLRARGGVEARGVLGERRFSVACERADALLFEVVGVAGGDPGAPFPLGAFSASGPEGVSLTWLAPKRDGTSRDLKLRTSKLSGRGRGRDPQGRPALFLRFPSRWATTLKLPNRGLAKVNGGRAAVYLDPAALRAGAQPEEKEEAYLRRVLRGLEIDEGLRITASGFEARAKRAEFDPQQGAYLLSGDPVVLRRGGLRQTMREATIRLSEE